MSETVAPAKPGISVVIPSFNSEATIRECLAALRSQTLPKGEYEVIVIDSSTDRTPEIIRREFPEVRLVHLDQKTLPGPARNLGVQHAVADLVMFTDSDCVMENDLLARMIARHDEGEFAVVGGSIMNGTPGNPIGTVDYLLAFSPFMPSQVQRFVSQLPTCNACYRRSALVEAQLFPAYNFLAEDLILNRRIFDGGGKLLFDPAIRITHINRTALGPILTHQRKLGWSFALALRCIAMPGRFFLRHPAMAAFLPLIRFGSLCSRVINRDRKVMLIALFLLPLYLVAASSWAFGFVRGATMGEREFRARLDGGF